MQTFMHKITDQKTRLCTKEQWEALTKNPTTKQNINMFRTTGDIKWKQQLPVVNFQGYDPAILTGNIGSRLQSNLQPTGLFMLDVDHIEQPKQLWRTFKEVLKKAKIPLEKEVALVHVTPSGQGLRIVMKGREGSTIKADQEWLADLLGVKHDVCTKDLSRWSFVPREEDILYINTEVMFGQMEATGYNRSEHFGNAGAENMGNAGAENFGNDEDEFAQKGQTPLCKKDFPTIFKGTTYKEIVWDILQQDEQAREQERAWAESQQNKKANEKGTERPRKPIRILNSDVTPAALLQRLYAAEHYGYCKDQRVFTKVEEIEELYTMAPVPVARRSLNL